MVLPLERARYYPMVRLCSLITSIYYMEKSTSHRIRLALVIYSRVVVQMMSCLSAECGGKYPTKSKSFTLHTDNLYFHDLKEITLHGHEWLSERGISLSQTSEEACEKVCRIYHFFSLLVFFPLTLFFWNISHAQWSFILAIAGDTPVALCLFCYRRSTLNIKHRRRFDPKVIWGPFCP